MPVRRISADVTRTRVTPLATNPSNSTRIPAAISGPGVPSPPPAVSSTVSLEVDDDDDFFDAAEDTGADEFDVILPATTPTTTPSHHQTLAEKEGMVDALQSIPASSSAGGGGTDGADTSMEYESDMGDSDTDDQSKEHHRGNRAHVIQKHAWGKAGYVCY